jgi:hypothetical protein
MIRSHYIRSNKVSRIPSRWIYLDTEANEHLDGTVKVQTWRLAVTCYERWDSQKGRWTKDQWATHHDPRVCWEWVSDHTANHDRTIVVAHNLAYDLRIGQAFTHLPALGWNLDSFNVGERSCAFTWRRANRTLVLVDSFSWLPTSLAKIGSLVGKVKDPLPEMTDSNDTWEHRCQTDVAILRTAFRDLLDWVRQSDLGNWQRTGAGQSWATWRHKFMHNRVLVHDDEMAQTAEAASAYTGRCEAWQHGLLAKGPYTEWDLPLAYPRVAADTALPFQLIGRRRGANWRYVVNSPPGRRYLVNATVDTPSPILPVSTLKGVCWPVGRVQGWWWDCELRAAHEAGARITAHEMICYGARPFLREWADWVIAQAEGTSDDTSPVRQVAAKHQARALIGRFASKHQVWADNGPAIDTGVDMHRISNYDTGALGWTLEMGDKSWVSWEQSYADNAIVAVMSAVMAECRVRLWHLMQVAGLENIVYVDTDSLITDPVGSRNIESHIAQGMGWGIRPKGSHRVLEVLGPRQLFLGSEVRAAGMPKQAFIVQGHVFGGAHWEGLQAALGKGHESEVQIRQATWSMTGEDNRRVHLPNGRTESLMLENPWLAVDGIGAA